MTTANKIGADVIVHGGRIATQDQRRSFASAVAIKDGRFLAVGTGQDVMAHRDGNTHVIDVGGRTVIRPWCQRRGVEGVGTAHRQGSSGTWFRPYQ